VLKTLSYKKAARKMLMKLKSGCFTAMALGVPCVCNAALGHPHSLTILAGNPKLVGSQWENTRG